MDALIILGAVALLALLVIRANVVLAYHWDWSVVGTYLLRTDPKTGELVPNLLLQGFFTTIRLAVWSLLLGSLVGAIGAGLLAQDRLRCLDALTLEAVLGNVTSRSVQPFGARRRTERSWFKP